MSLNTPSLFCVRMCYNTHPANIHCSVVFWQKTHARGMPANPCTRMVVVLASLHFCDSSHLFIIFHPVHTNAHKTYNHCSSILTERILMASKTWISITHCFFSFNNNLLNTFFIISGKNSVDLHFIYMECELQGSLHNLQNVHMNLTSLGHKPRDKTFAEAKSELCRWHPKQLLPP